MSSLFTGLLPHDCQPQTNQDQRQAQPIPYPNDSPAFYKAEPISQGKPDEPITEQIPDHRRPRISQAPKRPGGDDLDAIEELEKGGDAEQRDGQPDGVFVMRHK